MTQLRLEFDLSDVRRDIDGIQRALVRLVDYVADELAEEAAGEARPRSRRLGEPWEVEGSGAERRVVAPEFFAHFLALGTRDHGPKRDASLVFQVDGMSVFAKRVRGIRADPFHERARKAVGDRVDRLFGELIDREVA